MKNIKKLEPVETIKPLRQTRTHIDSNGEIINWDETTSGDANFHKTWWPNLILLIGNLQASQRKLVDWLITRADDNNQINATQKIIHESSGIGIGTVKRTMSYLQDIDFMRKCSSGYMINPDLIYYGKHRQRKTALRSYSELKQGKKKKASETEVSNV